MDSSDEEKVGLAATDAGLEKLESYAQKVREMPQGDQENSRFLMKGGKNFGTGRRGMTVTVPLTTGGKTQWTLHMAVNSTEFYWAILESTGKLTFIVVLLGIV